ncbi:hypothetical protein HNP84_009506 [Thermocatellispora tengchongensis]|uniref:Glycoside hydrolase n=1 Tax=Thermocatellispora tengchongensis TaxID=1073253 RepID=A0A840PKX1_9ACTN|nr:hypothetical protein [Thermocatellispora tengchongensis]MBB5139742.1 hypothetical protein [Thermocatellispora tengchongensis]
MRRVLAALAGPPRTHSPAAIWWWSGEPLRRDRLRWQMERLVAGGVANLVILNLAPSGPLFGADADDPPFFSEAWWELLDGVCQDAAELGAYLWFYDQLGFSGADIQARLVRERPEYAGQWLAPDGSVTRRGFDYLSAEACATLIDRVHGEFERRLGHRFGGVIAGSFQDELPAVPTWTSGFAERFEELRGRPLDVAALSRDPAMLRDFHRTRADLAEEAFFKPLAAWHERHGLLHGCDQQDPARAGHPVEGVRLYADYTRTHRWFGAPGSDHHGDARLHASLAHLYGRPRTWIEAFHSTGWGGTLEETFDWLLPWLRAGANLYNPHAVYYTTKAGWWEWAPPSTDWRQPYWRHHRVFADAVTRLCAALSLGRHLCDVAVLFPAATAQAGTALDGSTAGFAAEATRTYRALVGDMAWFDTVPGVLDRLNLDADVIDEDSVRRAAVVPGGRLEVAEESYRVIVLPAVTELDDDIAARLAEFAAAGGVLVAVGTRPIPAAIPCAAPEDLGEALAAAGFRPRVEAPVPPLVREVDGTTLVFLTAAAPRASRVGVGRPEERGVDLGWLDAAYDFDPGRYAREMRVRVRGVTGTPLLAEVFGSGPPRPLPHEVVDGVVEVVVPFTDGPAALLLFPGTDTPVPGPPPEAEAYELDLGREWDCELVPTLDDTWGDFGVGPGVVERREVGGLHATYGPHGVWRTPGAGWRPAVYSTSRGLLKDPIHRDRLGPKGHVPEEFLDFGTVAAGTEVTYRTRVTVPEESWLVAGAPTAKRARLDGRDLPLADAGYLAVARVPTPPGVHDLELVLTAEEDGPVRAHVSFARDPVSPVRPEWITGALVSTTELTGETTLQVASLAPCAVHLNGQRLGVQGGFDPYAEADIPRVRRYDLTGVLRPDGNTIAIEASGPVLVDGAAVSGPHWTGATVRRRQHGDPAALHLRRRPHPLPGAGWLEEGETAVPAVFACPDAVPGELELTLLPPPGATKVEIPAIDGLRTLHVPDKSRPITIKIPTAPGFEQGAALTGPIRFTCVPSRIALGDWEALGLPEYSGGVRYTTRIELAERPPRASLDLGRVRGTAEVRVNGVPAGVRVCSPYAFDVSDALRAGENAIEVLVLNTLAPHLDSASPTHFVFPGQRISGLFGPVTLRATRPPEARHKLVG